LSISYSRGLISALTSLEHGATDQDRLGAIDLLLALRGQFATDRKLNLLLGRLYRMNKDFDNAIQALSVFLDEKKKKGEAKDKDYADLLYNRACYHALKAGVLGPDQGAAEREAACKDLVASIELVPENKLEAKGEPDFSALAGDPTFKAIIS